MFFAMLFERTLRNNLNASLMCNAGDFGIPTYSPNTEGVLLQAPITLCLKVFSHLGCYQVG